jgi:hypothetical protein
MLPTRRTRLIRTVAGSAALSGLTYLLIAAVRQSDAFAVDVYLPFSRAVSGLLGALFSFSSYAVAETLIVMAVAAVILCLGRSVVRSVRERSGWPLLLWLSGAILYTVGSVFLFMLLWGGNYYAPKLEVRFGLSTEAQYEEVLYRTAMRHLDDVIHYAVLIPRNEDGTVNAGGFEALAPDAAQAMRTLAERHPELFGRAVISPPKRAVSYPLLGKLGISGIYSPFTGEAIVNPISTDPFLPSVMTHELAHRLGFAPEEDANFIAYLACMESTEPIFRYSGSLMAYSYCYNALSNQEYKGELRNRLYEEAGEVFGDFGRNREMWDRYRSPLRNVGEAVNNAYLQTMGQQEGIRSYGRVVDLLIALYIQESGSG